MKRKLVESSLGIRTTEDTARYLDEVLKELPKDSAYQYRRKGVAGTDTTVQATERVDTSRVTTKAMDRDNEIVDPAGLDLDHYRLNPIVLFGHDQDRPVGKALWIKADAEGVVAKTQYTARPEQYVGEWLPDFVFSMVQADVLRGKSIGFLPLEIREPDAAEVELNPGLQAVITRSLLLEYSVVSVPSNPAALVETIGKGQALGPWTYKVVGKLKPKAKAPVKPKAKPIDLEKLAEEMSRIHTPEWFAKAAERYLLQKWEV